MRTSLDEFSPGGVPLRRMASRREREVYEQLLKGHTAELIARDLGIAVKTARNHMSAVYSFCDVFSQTELIAAALAKACEVGAQLPGIEELRISASSRRGFHSEAS